jgi:hypothetical protein
MVRDKHRSKTFENRVLRRIFGHESDEMAGDWRNLHNEESYNLYCSPNKWRMRWTEHVAMKRE